MHIVGKILSNNRGAEKILEACKWFFEGISGDNELLSFIKIL